MLLAVGVERCLIAHACRVIDVSVHLNDGAVVTDEDELWIGTVDASSTVAVTELEVTVTELAVVILVVAVADDEEPEALAPHRGRGRPSRRRVRDRRLNPGLTHFPRQTQRP